MRKHWQILAGLLALVAALVAGQYAYRQYNQIVATAPIPVIAVPVRPYTLITENMLQVRSLPRPLLQEPIYTNAADLVGQMSTQELAPGQIVYRHQVVAPQSFRLASPKLEVVSLPVAVEQAVGGAIRVGSRVNLYRVEIEPQGQPPVQSTTPYTRLDDTDNVQLLAEYVPVVDVREKTGGPATQDTTSTSPNSRSASQPSQRTERVPIQIVTLAVPHEQAIEIVRLAGESNSQIKFWLTLAPLTSSPEVTPTIPITNSETR